MSGYTSDAVKALARIERGEGLTDRDRAIIEPMLRQAVESARIPFLTKPDGYVIGHAKRPALKGLGYCRAILMAAPSYVRAIDIAATSQQEGDPATDDTIDIPGSPGSNFRGAGVSLPKQPIYDWKTIREIREHMRELRLLDTVEAYEELDSLREILGAATFKGETRSFVDETEKARQCVTQAIRYALRSLAEDPETREIGLHLRKHIRTGFQCVYHGGWKWKFS
jgi:hypothetical protein